MKLGKLLSYFDFDSLVSYLAVRSLLGLVYAICVFSSIFRWVYICKEFFSCL